MGDGARSEPANGVSPDRAYVEWMRQLFPPASCVQGMFTPSAERLAATWHARGIKLETVQRAWLLAFTRKSLSLLDRRSEALIRNLCYFVPLLEEVLAESFPADCWIQLQFNVER